MDWILHLAWILPVFLGPWIPKDFDILIGHGRAYAIEENYDLAIEAFTKAVRLDPKSPTGYERRGDAFLLKGDSERAVADYSEALRLLPKDAKPDDRGRLLSQRGVAYSFAENYDRALADQDELIRLDPKSAMNYFDRGQTYFSRKDYQRALADFTQVIRLEPQFALAYTSRSGVYQKLNDYRHAVADLREAARLDSQDLFDLHLSLAWLLSTCPDAEIRDGREAVKLARKVCKAERWKDSLSLAVLAAAHAETGNFEKAIKWQKKAVERADDSYREKMRKPLELYERGEPYREQ